MQLAAPLLILTLTAPFALAQGSLTPPAGPPAPTMKTLGQIEPRIPLGPSPAMITNGGSYYLTGNLTGVSAQNGITVDADNVTLDLSGFVLAGGKGSSNGVFVVSGRKNVSVQNGTVTGWQTGVQASGAAFSSFRGLACAANLKGGITAGTRAVIEDCRVDQNDGDGIVAGDNSSILRCAAKENFGNGIVVKAGGKVSSSIAQDNTGAGILGSEHSTFSDCQATGNSGSGLGAGPGSVLDHCQGHSNLAHGMYVEKQGTIRDCSAQANVVHGIMAQQGSQVERCSSFNNSASGIYLEGNVQALFCTAGENVANGFQGGEGVQLISCKATGNIAAGFDLGGDAAVRECAASINHLAGIGAGASSQVAACKVRGNGAGIKVGSGSTVRDCTAEGNTSDGILFTSECTIVGNTANNNFNARNAAGLHGIGTDNIIQENRVTSNDRGLLISADGNFIVKNTAANNTLNFSITGFQQMASIVRNDLANPDPVSPFANFEF